MIFEHLTERDTQTLNSILREGQITSKTLPIGASTGWDSMGPMRDPKTDVLYPGIREALGRFSEDLRKYNLIFAVATNGPDIEGEDILNALVDPVTAFAVTEGGGRLIDRHPQTGKLGYTNLADENELKHLAKLEKLVAERPLMAALLGDRQPADGGIPIRTPYYTNIVLTLPTSYDVLNARLSAAGVDLQTAVPGVSPAEYIKPVLGYAHDQYTEVIQRLGLVAKVAVLTKIQNRRTYVMPKHNNAGVELNKYNGVSLGSGYMSVEPGYGSREYWMGNSVYVADKAVDQTGEGQLVIGASERSMIMGGVTYFGENSPNPDSVKVINVTPIEHAGRTIYIAEVACRLAVNVTMDDSLPRMERVEDITVLHIGSGLKAIEAISYLYQQLYG